VVYLNSEGGGEMSGGEKEETVAEVGFTRVVVQRHDVDH
jgi:hypothetical protein